MSSFVYQKNTSKIGYTTTVYAVQKFFVGDWEDRLVTGSKDEAYSEYQRYCAEDVTNGVWRRWRIVERQEIVLTSWNRNEENE